MKKISIALCLFLISFSLFAQALGDVNSSGSVDIVDALLIAQHYVGLSPANFEVSVADVNCSGLIDIVDALLVAQYYVGLISEFPCSLSPTPTPNPTPIPQPLLVGLGPDALSVFWGEFFDIGLYFISGSEDNWYTGMDIVIIYDPNLILVDSTKGVNGVEDNANPDCSIDQIINNPGRLQIIETDCYV